MSTIGWILFAACCLVCGVIGWILRGWRYEVLEYRAEERRVPAGAPINEGDQQ